MAGDLAWLIIRLCGGFWSFREIMLRCAHGSLSRRALQSVYYLYLQRYGAYIAHSAQFESEPCFPHNLHGIFIAGGARIGKGCVIFHQVTIGANSLPDSKGVGSPVVGDNVYVGAGAKIIGGITIGHGCRIGANCVVTIDVPDHAVAVSPRPTVAVRDDHMDNRYYRWSPDGPVYFESGRWVLERDPQKIERLRNAL